MSPIFHNHNNIYYGIINFILYTIGAHMDVIIFLFSITTIYLFLKKEKYSTQRELDAERYFNCSKIDKNYYGSGPYTQGLALINNGKRKTKFVKQKKSAL